MKFLRFIFDRIRLSDYGDRYIILQNRLMQIHIDFYRKSPPFRFYRILKKPCIRVCLSGKFFIRTLSASRVYEESLIEAISFDWLPRGYTSTIEIFKWPDKDSVWKYIKSSVLYISFGKPKENEYYDKKEDAVLSESEWLDKLNDDQIERVLDEIFGKNPEA